MTTLVLIKWLSDTREEYKYKQKNYQPEDKWWMWYQGKIDLCESLIALLRSA